MPPVRQQAIDVLARQAVADVSPAELPLFRATAARYHQDPVGTLSVKTRSDQALGFGAEAAVVLVTPFALDLVRRLFASLVEKVGDGVTDTLAERVLAWFGASDRASPPPEAPALSAETLALVAETTRDEATQLALPTDQAERLADAVVAALAVRAAAR